MNIVPITVWREARNQGAAGMEAVTWVIYNRAASGPWPSNPEKVCLQAYQFSCWNTHDPQRDLWPEVGDKEYVLAADLWFQMKEKIAQGAADPTGGATFYCNPATCHSPFENSTYVCTAVIGSHHFYKHA